MTEETVLHPGLNLGARHPEAHETSETLVFGFWVFLMSDLIVFGLMAATYATMLTPWGLAGGPGPKDLFDLSSALFETALLLASSFTFGLAALAMKYRPGSAELRLWLWVTLALGLGFLALELQDLRDMIAAGGVPQRSGWLSAFWGLVPLHGLHVAAGCLWIGVMLVQIRVFGMTAPVKTRILRLGLFWHFLDIVWIGIVSMVYLGGLA
ncbi:MAG: cytochrome c oxidase subunit 3 [Pseudomonadota bacterium]